MRKVLDFLTQLSKNNNKAWFDAHKDEYLAMKARFESCAERIIAGIGEYDAEVRNLQVKDCTYRIYRDLRFSTDKTPYKTHMGLFMVKGGKKSGNAGYYFHLQANGESFLWAGLHCPEPAMVRSVREEISLDGDLYVEALEKAVGFELDKSDSLKRVPYEYPSDSPYAELLKLKSFGVTKVLDEDYLATEDFAVRVADEFRGVQPLVGLLNRAVEYAREMF
ncbi:MAG: DUF2461 domain-containing protein [Tidjanibacter sp.]|nr:DUF2461 domain-containing protein [Tidjanibacter sp.]